MVMKKICILMLFLSLLFHIQADDSNAVQKEEGSISIPNESELKSNFLYLRLTPLYMQGAALGYSISPRTWRTDLIFAAHYHYALLILEEVHESYGVSLIIENFSNPQRKGFFLKGNVGVEYADQSWASNDGKIMILLTGGVGLNIRSNDTSFFRISIDTGIPFLLFSINCEFLF